MMRTILFVNFLPEARQLRSIVKRIPYAPEDYEMYFIDISAADKERLGVDALSYLNNHYEDDTPCVWLMQPSHIASIHMPMKYMRLRLLQAMLRQFQNRYHLLDKAITACDSMVQILQRNILPQEIQLIARSRNVFTVRWNFGGEEHIFLFRDSQNVTHNLCRMVQQVRYEKGRTLQQQKIWIQNCLSTVTSAIEQAEYDKPRE
ncbi:hypothetical protein [uncultured Victivallis sp.]|uniref:hypothetical protein n=1 Tax=uncultured Victivallis sp. TaxID=354118 RepID=UPI002597E18D|nr:hypothetical protein [uncultured Victivallis sp.]